MGFVSGVWIVYNGGVPCCKVKSMSKEESAHIDNPHTISESDYWYLTGELNGQFKCLSGRLYSLIEELGLPDKQEAAAKRHLKVEVWERYNDICMSLRLPEYQIYGTMNGIPNDDQI